MPIKVPAGERKTRPAVLPPVPISEKKSRTVREFCARNNVSISMFYKLRGLGKAPRLFYIGASPRITDAAEEEWQRDREAEAAVSSAA